MNMPLNELVERAQSIHPERDIYIYGGSDTETTQAATALRDAGFESVAELQGGLQAWQAIAGPTDGINENPDLNAGAYNVVSRLAHHLQTQNKGV
jgi:rhodanese-related sulfurtransferase